MLVDSKATAEYIQNWITFQAGQAKATSLVVGVSGGVDSAVVLALAKATGLPTYGVIMPCQSSESAMTRAQEVIAKFDGVRKVEVNLDPAFYSITEQVHTTEDATLESVRASEGALRSCLRAPTLDYVAKTTNGIIVGTGNKDEDQVTRYYQKRGDGAVDISPIAQLHKSEVYELAGYLGVPQSVIEATPSADLWGPEAGQTDEAQLGMTYDEIETATRFVERIYSNTSYQAFLQAALPLEEAKVGERLTQVMRKLGEMERTSRHKYNPCIPVCNVRDSGAVK